MVTIQLTSNFQQFETGVRSGRIKSVVRLYIYHFFTSTKCAIWFNWNGLAILSPIVWKGKVANPMKKMVINSCRTAESRKRAITGAVHRLPPIGQSPPHCCQPSFLFLNATSMRDKQFLTESANKLLTWCVFPRISFPAWKVWAWTLTSRLLKFKDAFKNLR